MFDKRLYKLALFIGVSVALLALSMLGGVACDAGTEPPTETVTVTEPVTATDIETASGEIRSAEPLDDTGVSTLEEMIVIADVIAVVNLNSVKRGLDIWKPVALPDADILYSKTLEFTFDVEQYLKGKGEEQVVGIVLDFFQSFDTAAEAELAKDPDPDRNTNWDDRKAVVFLRDHAKDPRVNWEAGRYYLGMMNDWQDIYSVASGIYRAWLPAVSESDDEQRFLLGSEPGVSSPRTITLDDLKVLVSYIDQQLEGQTDEYKDCILHHYTWHRQVRHRKESLGGKYHYSRSDSTVGSGMPEGTHVFTSDVAGYFILSRRENPLQMGQEDKYMLAGRDTEYFVGAWPGEIFVARPLPAGEYRVYHAHLAYEWHMCGGTVPEDQMGKEELFVNVTAPTGTVYEAFFDPVEDGSDLAATFTDGPIQRIAWEPVRGDAGMIKMTATPNSLAGKLIHFIALDGSVSMSLSVDDVTAANRTLTWTMNEPPWQAGDKLMLRISG